MKTIIRTILTIFFATPVWAQIANNDIDRAVRTVHEVNYGQVETVWRTDEYGWIALFEKENKLFEVGYSINGVVEYEKAALAYTPRQIREDIADRYSGFQITSMVRYKRFEESTVHFEATIERGSMSLTLVFDKFYKPLSRGAENVYSLGE